MVKKRFRSKKSVVYLLRCPVTGLVRYIGETNNIFARFRQHLETAKNKEKNQWILWLKEQGKQPILEFIQTFETKEQGLDFEKEMIKKYAESVLNVYINDQTKEKLEDYRRHYEIKFIPLQDDTAYWKAVGEKIVDDIFKPSAK